MEWLYVIMNTIEKDKNILHEFKVNANNFCVDNGIRLEMY